MPLCRRPRRLLLSPYQATLDETVRSLRTARQESAHLNPSQAIIARTSVPFPVGLVVHATPSSEPP